ncbi:MAG: hypoxanthine-guanine phosphoribosyltransferase, partial [Proteobacteria bacterium]|nr:hypoxanthine-guanine phosphoribosyltransferase [Pseudomonadota bacterium]
MDMTAARDTTLEEAIRIRETARQLVSPAEIRAALDRMAAAAGEVLAKENPLVLAVMNGGAFTAVELCQRMDFPHELDFLHVTRYEGELVGGELSWRAWPDRDLSGRTILVVDDIVDHG